VGVRHKYRQTLPDPGGHKELSFYGTKFVDKTEACYLGDDELYDFIDGTRHPHGGFSVSHQILNINEDQRLNGGGWPPPAENIQFKYQSWVPDLYRVYSMGHNPINMGGFDPLTKTIALSNPSKPLFNLPLAIGELKDLPGLFMGVGNKLLRYGANAFLSYQYGWKPFIKDLRSFVNVHKYTHQKMRELRNLYSGNGSRRRINLGKRESSGGQSNILIDNMPFGVEVRADMTSHTIQEQWSTIRWWPTSEPPQGDAAMAQLANDTALGFTNAVSDWMHGSDRGKIDVAANIWALMPFSWLLGWFTNVNDFIEGARNTVPAKWEPPCIMTRRRTIYRFTRRQDDLTHGLVNGGDAIGEFVTKERVISSDVPLTAGFPFFNGTQLSILGALGIQRLRGV
jgi:hypothetical protein